MKEGIPMLKENEHIKIDRTTKFNGMFYIEGIILRKGTNPVDHVDGIKFTSKQNKILFQKYTLKKTPKYVRFFANLILKKNEYPKDCIISFNINLKKHSVLLLDIINQTKLRVEGNTVNKRFTKYISELPKNSNVLDIGGRARSGNQRSDAYKNVNVTTLDIIADPGVHVVCDAHEMSNHLPKNHFDACYSISVFEHLIMPWKAALEINKILKMGGIALVHSHQTLGMHDIPWDFYRFSDTAWDGIFNAKSGFEIIERTMVGAMYILPFLYEERMHHAEKSAGFQCSTIMVKKISDTNLEWPVATREIISHHYPED